jgi:integrase
MSGKNNIKKYQKSGDTYYLIDFHLRGFRVRQRGFISKPEAQMVLGKIRAEILLGTYNPSEYRSKRRQSSMTFEELVISWLKGCKSVKDSTKGNYRYTYNARMKKDFSKKKLNEITGKYINRFLERMLVDYSAGYAGIVYTLLRSILGWAEKMDYISTAPKFCAPRNKHPKQKRFLSMEDIKKMINHAYSNPNDYELEWINMFRFAVLSGVRIGELRALRAEDIDKEKNQLTIARRIYRGSFNTPKNGKIQSIPIHPELLEVIESQINLNTEIMRTDKYKKHNQLELFLSSHSGKRVSEGYFVKRLKQCALEALGSNNGISPHTLRRSLSDYLIESGLNINQVSGMLRNTNVVMLRHYSRQSLDSLTADFNTMEISGSYEEK